MWYFWMTASLVRQSARNHTPSSVRKPHISKKWPGRGSMERPAGRFSSVRGRQSLFLGQEELIAQRFGGG